MTPRLTVPVWVDEWQHACCGAEFAVGDRVSWTLGPADTGFLAPQLRSHLPTWSMTLPALRAIAAEGGLEIVIAGQGDLAVHLPDAGPGASHSVGLLAHESHGRVGSGMATTTGRVRSIRVVRWSWVERPPGSRRHEPVPDTATLTAVQSSAPGPPTPETRGYQGLLVELDVAG